MPSRRVLTALLACVALPTAAQAQTIDPAGPAQAGQGAATPAADGGLADVVVTAERREANLQRVPISVSAVTGDALRTFQSGGEDVLSLAGRVPGLYAETTTGRIFPRFYIRGLGNIDFYLGASQPVSIIHDDIVLEHVVLKSNPVFDVAQVEVLRGPQGSLFGRNTTAGIIKFDTIRPSDDFQARGSFSYGSYDTVTADVGVGGPIVPGLLSFRLSGLYQHRDDWIDNGYDGPSFDGTRGGRDALGGFDERDVRLQLRLTPDPSLTIDLSGHARDYDGTSTVFYRQALPRGSNHARATRRDRVRLDEAGNNPQAYETYGGSARVAWDFGAATLTSITGYETTLGFSRGDTDGGAAADFPVNGNPNGYGQSRGNIRDLDQWTQELRLASSGDTAFKWQVGGFYFDNRDTTEFYQRRFFLTPAFVATNPNTNNPDNWVQLRNVNTSWAVFGQASYTIDRLTLTGGARYTEDRKRTILVRPARTGATVNFPAGAPRDVRLVGKEPSWDVSALYEIDPRVNVYARIARGFRGPTIQGRSAVFGSPFTTADSETIMSYEAGFKSQPTARLRFNATGFYWRTKDIQLNGNDADGASVLFNADAADAYGIEAEAEWRPIRNIAFSLGASALRTKIRDERVFAQVCALNGRVTCTVLDPTITRPLFGAPTVFAQIDGNPLPNAPRYQVNAAVRYDIPLAEHGNLFVASDVNMQGFTNFVLYRTREFFADDNLELGLKIGYTDPSERFELAAFARNITNEQNLKGVIENFNAAVFNEPRIIGVSLTARTR